MPTGPNSGAIRRRAVDASAAAIALPAPPLALRALSSLFNSEPYSLNRLTTLGLENILSTWAGLPAADIRLRP